MEQDDRDLLIRIGTRQELMISDVAHIKNWMADAPCKTQAEKVKTLERIVWGSVLASICATVKAFLR